MPLDTDAELSRLRAVVRDVLAVSSIAAAWTRKEPRGVATGFADAVRELLHVDFAFVRLCDPDGAGAVEVTRGYAWRRFPAWLEEHRARVDGDVPHGEFVPDVGRGRGLVIPIGVGGDRGVVAVASERSDFPTETERLLLSHVANQAAIAFENTRLLQERRRAEEELREDRHQLEVKVVERTAKLARSEAYLAELAEEQGALRRVATLVAEGASPAAVFDAVAAEVEELLDADRVLLSRYEAGDKVTIVAHRGPGAERVPPGTRASHAEGDSVTATVWHTARPARIEHLKGTAGEVPALARKLGLRTSVGAPIIVEGGLWGVITASWTVEQPPPLGTEERMADFAELLETAIANADGRDQLAASRARLLTEGDEARRRVVRDLHDGAQQRLVQTILILKLARRALEEADGNLESLIADALEQAEQGNAELRELAQGILPPILTRGGLRAAVDSLSARLDLPVAVDIPAERFPEETEANAYFIVAEALTNVVKHAQAAHAAVLIHAPDAMLHVEVSDDGIGGADPDGHGLIGLRDRASALGGSLELESPASGGTLVSATLPLATG
ncbi:MAG TPA: GAF domain-containing protein [Thermoleophilaceae bacterium]|nr:GAF domain-containing protein [Thermoleophilaceae bacterium]